MNNTIDALVDGAAEALDSFYRDKSHRLCSDNL
jgi:hypothetical protein